MSFDLYVFENSSFYRPQSAVAVSVAGNGNENEETHFFDENFSPFYDSVDVLNQNQSFIDQNNLFSNGCHDLSSMDVIEVKSEDSNNGGFDCFFNNHQTQNQNQYFYPHSYSGAENVSKYMQRSLSSNSFDHKQGLHFQPRFDTLMESSPNIFTSPENSFFTRQMRRVCSTGDLQNITQTQKSERSYSNPLTTETSFMEENNFKVGRYSAEERKEKISKYRAKRNQRNFNKTIKYACRKTLADNRPRIRGRFARNDEICEIPKASCSVTRDDDEDDLFWLDGLHLHEEEDERAMNMRGNGDEEAFGHYPFHCNGGYF